jgi:hypothetical protein
MQTEENNKKSVRCNRIMRKGLFLERKIGTKSARQKSTICVIIKKDLQTICVQFTIPL